jgi:hypothetical protein
MGSKILGEKTLGAMQEFIDLYKLCNQPAIICSYARLKPPDHLEHYRSHESGRAFVPETSRTSFAEVVLAGGVGWPGDSQGLETLSESVSAGRSPETARVRGSGPRTVAALADYDRRWEEPPSRSVPGKSLFWPVSSSAPQQGS